MHKSLSFHVTFFFKFSLTLFLKIIFFCFTFSFFLIFSLYFLSNTSLLTGVLIFVFFHFHKYDWSVFTEPTVERGRTLSRISVAKGSNLNFRGRKSNSLMNLCGKAPQKTTKKSFFFFFFYKSMIIFI